MTNRFLEEIQGIYRLRIPFDTVYTSVFLIKANDKSILVDCATTAYDVDSYILPTLRAMGCGLTDVDMLVLTHRHGDHAGGMTHILELAPRIDIVSEMHTLCKDLSIYPLAGHTKDSIGVLDTRTGTLISGDGLQGAGVGKYRCYVADKEEYLKTIERIKKDERIENILFSHAYEPWYKDSIFGREKVLDILSKCTEYV